MVHQGSACIGCGCGCVGVSGDCDLRYVSGCALGAQGRCRRALFTSHVHLPTQSLAHPLGGLPAACHVVYVCRVCVAGLGAAAGARGRQRERRQGKAVRATGGRQESGVGVRVGSGVVAPWLMLWQHERSGGALSGRMAAPTRQHPPTLLSPPAVLAPWRTRSNSPHM